MNFKFNLSLEHIALLKVSDLLWNHFYTRKRQFFLEMKIQTVGDSLFDGDEGVKNKMKSWDTRVESEVIKNILSLQLPKRLIPKLSCLVKEMGLQILLWLSCYSQSSCKFGLPKKFYWTLQGTIDRETIVKTLVQDRNVDSYMRFKLACINCLEDQIYTLWKKLKSEKKHLRCMTMWEDPLVAFWSHSMEGQIHEMKNRMIRLCENENVTPLIFAFQYSAYCGYISATKYFFKKINNEIEHDTLVKTVQLLSRGQRESEFKEFHVKQHGEVLCFLLSQIDECQQKDLLKVCCEEVLCCLLDWPWRKYFIETALLAKEFISGKKSYLILNSILKRKDTLCVRNVYEKLFEEFWQLISPACKKYVVSQCAYYNSTFLRHLLYKKDKKSIKLILKEATPEERKRIMYNQGFYLFSDNAHLRNDMQLMFNFIEDCILPDEEETIEDELLTYFSRVEIEQMKNKWDGLLE